MNTSLIPEIAERENLLLAMLQGRIENFTPEQAAVGLAAASANRHEDVGGGTLGFGIIAERQLGHGGDWQEFVLAVTDGERDATITASVNGSRVATLGRPDKAVRGELLDRSQSATGSLPNDGRRYDNVVLSHPLRFQFL